MFAALSSTNTAVLRARSADQLFSMVCQSVAKGGRSLGAAAIFLKDGNASDLKIAAVEGELVHLIKNMKLSVDPENEYGQGLHGPAFRDQTLQISFNTAEDPRTHRWVAPGIIPHGCAALPITKGDTSVGILFFFFAASPDREDPAILQLMTDIAANVSFALELFEREEQKDQVSRMFAALSATNEALMKATSRDELYQMVCEAAVRGGKFTSTTIFLAKPADDYFALVGAAGPNADIITSRRYSTRENVPEGRGLTGTTFRTGQPCVKNDFRKNEKLIDWPYPNNETRSANSGACFPLFSNGNIAGVLLFMAAEKDTFN
ncbi:MAG: GAF domain-containing protein, partial [Solirubrobacteraceae bacterium]|nr:GAF domain-containing protein [Solirubrobacteraceae bacterium]